MISRYDRFCVFTKISQVLERFLLEHIQTKDNSVSELKIDSICSVGIRSRNHDTLKKTVGYFWGYFIDRDSQSPKVIKTFRSYHE